MTNKVTNKRYENLDPILASAYKIIDQSWIDAGVTWEELERDDVMMDVYDGLIARGKTEKEAGDYIGNASWEEIQERHRELFPAPKNQKASKRERP